MSELAKHKWAIKHTSLARGSGAVNSRVKTISHVTYPIGSAKALPASPKMVSMLRAA